MATIKERVFYPFLYCCHKIGVCRGNALSETLVSYVRLQFVCYYVRGVRSVKNFYHSLRLHVIQSNKLLRGITFVKSFAFTLCPLSIRAV